MNSLIKFLALGTLVLSPLIANASDETPEDREMLVAVSDAFVPGGFDSQSDAYVVESGIFPNGCYRFNRADVVAKEGNVHEVRTYATVKQGMCLMVLVPFTKDVKLGKLSAGTHTIRFINGDGTYMVKSLNIEN